MALSNEQIERYSRQIIVPGVGSTGQERLLAARLVIAGELADETLPYHAVLCGSALARAHARSGDPVAIDAYMGRSDAFTKAMRRFARRYADQNERDHAQLVAAIRRGKVDGVPE